MDADRWDEQVGSVADEATRLLESLRRSAEDAAAAQGEDGASADEGVRSGHGAPADDAGRAERLAADSGPTEDRTAAHDPLCTWCPLCRSAAVLRSLSPETLVRLADLAAVAASVLADLASARARAAGDDPATDDAATTPGAAGPPIPRARPIPILDADDPQEAPRG